MESRSRLSKARLVGLDNGIQIKADRAGKADKGPARLAGLANGVQIKAEQGWQGWPMENRSRLSKARLVGLVRERLGVMNTLPFSYPFVFGQDLEDFFLMTPLL